VSTAVTLIGGLAIVTAGIKAAGPIVLGGRRLPAQFLGVITLLAPALLAALVVTATLADGKDLAVGEHTVGVAAGGAVAWRTGSIIWCVIVAAAVTAGLRAL